MSRDHGLFVEKYRPQVIDDFVGDKILKDTIKKFLSQNDIVNMLFFGSAGTGKTSLAKLIIKNLDCDYKFINASDERGIDTVREKIIGFASSASFKSIKVIVLDEVDFMMLSAQSSLRTVIETYSKTTRFILTCNQVERVIDPIQSRCQLIKITPPSKKEIAIHLSKICELEEVKCDIPTIGKIVNKFYPDLRKMLNTMQLSVKDGEIRMDSFNFMASSQMDEIIKELNKKTPYINNIRKITLDLGINQFDELYRYLFDNLSKFSKDKDGKLIMSISKHMFQDGLTLDKEINFLACLSEIVEILKTK